MNRDSALVLSLRADPARSVLASLSTGNRMPQSTRQRSSASRPRRTVRWRAQSLLPVANLDPTPSRSPRAADRIRVVTTPDGRKAYVTLAGTEISSGRRGGRHRRGRAYGALAYSRRLPALRLGNAPLWTLGRRRQSVLEFPLRDRRGDWTGPSHRSRSISIPRISSSAQTAASPTSRTSFSTRCWSWTCRSRTATL